MKRYHKLLILLFIYYSLFSLYGTETENSNDDFISITIQKKNIDELAHPDYFNFFLFGFLEKANIKTVISRAALSPFSTFFYHSVGPYYALRFYSMKPNEKSIRGFEFSYFQLYKLDDTYLFVPESRLNPFVFILEYFIQIRKHRRVYIQFEFGLGVGIGILFDIINEGEFRTIKNFEINTAPLLSFKMSLHFIKK